MIYLVKKKLSELTVGTGGGFENGNKSYDKILGIRIPYLLINLMSFHGFLKNINSYVILKCHKNMLEYYSSKILTLSEFSTNNFAE